MRRGPKVPGRWDRAAGRPWPIWGMQPGHRGATILPCSRNMASRVLLGARSGLPETPSELDQRFDSVSAAIPNAVWRQAFDRALSALEMPGIVVVLGAADVRSTFVWEL